MIRKYLHTFKQSDKDKIKWRSHEPHRIEAFSDAVLAFAISLLIISLEVPKTSKDLLEMMKGFVPFIFCFAGIFAIWYSQYKFFRRYGMNDYPTLVLNGILLFVVLFYVYPLKFMFSTWIIGGYTWRQEDVAPLLVIYNGGFTAIFLIFSGMYFNAYLKREELQLTQVEIFETNTTLYTNLYGVCVGIIVILIGLFGGKYRGLCMAAYALMWGTGILDKKRKKLFKEKFGDVPIVEPHLGEE